MNPATKIVVEAEPNSGAWNMAVDEAMLEAAVERDECHLRFYRWKQATVSLGYFQKIEEAAADPLLAELPVVKRLSGGGAILHHHEWTYSCSVPASHSLSKHPVELYELIHSKIIDALHEVGIIATMRKDVATSSDATHPKTENGFVEPFLCFGRGDPRDIVIDCQKVLGSAQRRRRGSILQHGSLLTKVSKHAPQFVGLTDLAQISNVDRLITERVIPSVCELFEPTTMCGKIGEELSRRAIEFADIRYSNTHWKA